MKFKNILVATLMASASFLSHADVITFDAESVGVKANGYTVGGVKFFDTVGNDLYVYKAIEGNGTNALGVFNDDASFLRMVFPTLTSALSLSFGNDDPCCSAQGNKAVLTLFSNGTQVGQTTLNLNRNDLMDQTISISGINFTEATFGYATANGTPLDLIEVVDNINFTRAAVPEPGIVGLFGLGLLGFAASRRKAAKK